MTTARISIDRSSWPEVMSEVRAMEQRLAVLNISAIRPAIIVDEVRAAGVRVRVAFECPDEAARAIVLLALSS